METDVVGVVPDPDLTQGHAPREVDLEGGNGSGSNSSQKKQPAQEVKQD